MTPATEELKQQFDNAMASYIAQIRVRKDALEKAMASGHRDDLQNYTQQTQREVQLRAQYEERATGLMQRLAEMPRQA